jgi:hypothetical protein
MATPPSILIELSQLRAGLPLAAPVGTSRVLCACRSAGPSTPDATSPGGDSQGATGTPFMPKKTTPAPFIAPLGIYGQANHDFMTSEEMKTLADPTSLGASSIHRKFLENRLVRAFQIGIEKGESIAVNRMVANLTAAPR